MGRSKETRKEATEMKRAEAGEGGKQRREEEKEIEGWRRGERKEGNR